MFVDVGLVEKSLFDILDDSLDLLFRRVEIWVHGTCGIDQKQQVCRACCLEQSRRVTQRRMSILPTWTSFPSSPQTWKLIAVSFPLSPYHCTFYLTTQAVIYIFKNTSTASTKYRKRRNVGMASEPSGCITAKVLFKRVFLYYFFRPSYTAVKRQDDFQGQVGV